MRDPSPRVLRAFGAIYTPIALAVLTLSLARRHAPLPAFIAVGAIAVASIAIALVLPRALRSVYVGLSILTAPIGWLVARVLLSVVYYLVLTPIALVLRALGRDALDRRGTARWHKVDGARDIERNFRQY